MKLCVLTKRHYYLNKRLPGTCRFKMYFYFFMPGFVKLCIVPIMFNFNKGGDEVIHKWVAYGISALQDVGSVQKGKMVA